MDRHSNRRLSGTTLADRAARVPSEAASPKPTVYVVDDDDEVRDSLQRLIESVGLNVRPFHSAVAFLEHFDPAAPGCALVDERLPMMSGRALQQALVERGVRLPVIIMTAYPEVQTAVDAMKLGAMDYLQKPLREHLLIDTLHAALRTDENSRRAAAEQSEIEAKLSLLSPRERQVLDLITGGETNARVAELLGISKRTVELHRVQVMRKMGVRPFARLIALYTSFRSHKAG